MVSTVAKVTNAIYLTEHSTMEDEKFNDLMRSITMKHLPYTPTNVVDTLLREWLHKALEESFKAGAVYQSEIMACRRQT